jgi:hypothetical protein
MHSFKGTKRQAQTERSRLVTEMESGDYPEPSKVTLAGFFERWLRHIKPNVSPRTHYPGYLFAADAEHAGRRRRHG